MLANDVPWTSIESHISPSWARRMWSRVWKWKPDILICIEGIIVFIVNFAWNFRNQFYYCCRPFLLSLERRGGCRRAACGRMCKYLLRYGCALTNGRLDGYQSTGMEDWIGTKAINHINQSDLNNYIMFGSGRRRRKGLKEYSALCARLFADPKCPPSSGYNGISLQ